MSSSISWVRVAGGMVGAQKRKGFLAVGSHLNTLGYAQIVQEPFVQVIGGFIIIHQ
jgi:hypothetical protein